jgi:hypothetical protein
MSKKLTIEQVKLECEKRRHTLINVSNLENIRNGNIVATCSNYHMFTVTLKSYFACRVCRNGLKNGCPLCKRESTSNFWKGRWRKKQNSKELNNQNDITKTKKTPKVKKRNPIFTSVTNRQTLMAFLKDSRNKNAYNTFILSLLDKESEFTMNQGEKSQTNVILQKHHIIPLHAGGPDEIWNLVKVTVKDHVTAHRLRYLVYNEDGDERFLRFRENLNTNYFPREVLKKQVPLIIQERLSKPTIWYHNKFPLFPRMPSVELPSELYDYFLEFLTINSELYIELSKTTKSSFSKGICRVLSGKGKKVKGWSLLNSNR